MKSRFLLEEAVRSARARTGVPGVAAALSVGRDVEFAADGLLALGRAEPVRVETPFRVASISKPFTATLAAATLDLDARSRALLSHTAGYRCESPEPLPASCRGLWSYSNAGYWEAGQAVAEATGLSFSEAMQREVLEPFGLRETGFEEPANSARGHVQEGETGHRLVSVDGYPVERRPSGGLWSTVGDLVEFGRRHLAGLETLHEPVGEAFGARYALGWWIRPLADGTTALDHEGSVAGYQSLLLLVPERELVLAVLTNSWRGSGLVRRVVEQLDLVPASVDPVEVGPAPDVGGAYADDQVTAVVTPAADGALSVAVTEHEPVADSILTRRGVARPLGGGVYGYGGGQLMTHRLDFPRIDVARIGMVALPRTSGDDERR